LHGFEGCEGDAREEQQEETMSMDSKKSMGWTMVLIVLGMAALYGGSKWLGVLIPVALLVWYAGTLRFRTGRN
jgi:hypothetical protein